MTHLDYLTRTERFTDKEFADLPRYGDDSIINLSEAFIWLTDEQVVRLAEDDCSRYEDYQEEMLCMVSDAMVEFGVGS